MKFGYQRLADEADLLLFMLQYPCVHPYSSVSYKVMQSSRHLPLFQRSLLAKQKYQFYFQTLFSVKLSSLNLIMSSRGRQIVTYMTFLSPYTLLLLSWKLCRNRRNYRALNVKVRHESFIKSRIFLHKEGTPFHSKVSVLPVSLL